MFTKAHLKEIIAEELQEAYDNRGHYRTPRPSKHAIGYDDLGQSPLSAFGISDDDIEKIYNKIKGMFKDKEEYVDRINPELTKKYMKQAGILDPDEEVPGEDEERRLARFRSSNAAKLDRLMGRKVKVAGIDEAIALIAEFTIEEYDAMVSEGHGGEGAMVVGQLNRMSQIIDELRQMVSEDDNHKEWVEAKITKAMDYVSTVLNYLSGKDDNLSSNI